MAMKFALGALLVFLSAAAVEAQLELEDDDSGVFALRRPQDLDEAAALWGRGESLPAAGGLQVVGENPFAIVNSLLIVLFLTGGAAMLMLDEELLEDLRSALENRFGGEDSAPMLEEWLGALPPADLQAARDGELPGQSTANVVFTKLEDTLRSLAEGRMIEAAEDASVEPALDSAGSLGVSGAEARGLDVLQEKWEQARSQSINLSVDDEELRKVAWLLQSADAGSFGEGARSQAFQQRPGDYWAEQKNDPLAATPSVEVRG